MEVLDRAVQYLHFVLATQITVTHVKKLTFFGINAVGKDFKICQLEDDTAKNQSQVSKAVAFINDYDTVSGLKMNFDKSVLFSVMSC